MHRPDHFVSVVIVMAVLGIALPVGTEQAETQVPGVAAVAVLQAAGGLAAAQAQPRGDFVPVTDAMLQDSDPADWLMWHRTLDGWGFRFGRHKR